jgi:hypothetical protein
MTTETVYRKSGPPSPYHLAASIEVILVSSWSFRLQVLSAATLAGRLSTRLAGTQTMEGGVAFLTYQPVRDAWRRRRRAMRSRRIDSYRNPWV